MRLHVQNISRVQFLLVKVVNENFLTVKFPIYGNHFNCMYRSLMKADPVWIIRPTPQVCLDFLLSAMV